MVMSILSMVYIQDEYSSSSNQQLDIILPNLSRYLPLPYTVAIFTADAAQMVSNDQSMNYTWLRIVLGYRTRKPSWAVPHKRTF